MKNKLILTVLLLFIAGAVNAQGILSYSRK